MINSEYQERYAGRYYGKYRGIVDRIDDPKSQGRVIVKVPAIMGTESLGWALPAPSSGGGVNTGSADFPVKGDYVWVEFEGGDPSFPIWMSGNWGTRNGESMLMEHSRGKADNADYSARDVGNIPPSQFAGEYSTGWMKRVQCGSFIELDSTPGVERVQLAHCKGSRFEITSDGSIQEVSCGNFRRRSEGNSYTELGGEDIYAVGGGRKSTITGFVEDLFGADYHRVVKAITEEFDSYAGTCQGYYALSSNAYAVTCNSSGHLAFGKDLAFMVGSNFQLTAMEVLNISASNATAALRGSLISTDPVITVQAYNGALVLRASDPTGLVNNTEIVLQGNPLVSNILLGGDLAVQSYVLGEMFTSLLTTLFTMLATHFHPTPAGPSGQSTMLNLPGTGLASVWAAGYPGTLSTTIKGRP